MSPQDIKIYGRWLGLSPAPQCETLRTQRLSVCMVLRSAFPTDSVASTADDSIVLVVHPELREPLGKCDVGPVSRVCLQPHQEERPGRVRFKSNVQGRKQERVSGGWNHPLLKFSGQRNIAVEQHANRTEGSPPELALILYCMGTRFVTMAAASHADASTDALPSALRKLC